MDKADTIKATLTRVWGVHRRVTSNEPEGPPLAKSAPVIVQPLANPSINTGCPRLPTPLTLAVQPLFTLCPNISSNGAVALLTRSCMVVAVLDATWTPVVGSGGGGAMA